jgi:hypothetical protein
MKKNKITNELIGDVLERIADLLDTQRANFHKIRAYRSAAKSVRSADRSLARLIRKNDLQAIKDLPFIGEGIASTMEEFVKTGKSRVLDRLQGEISPEEIFVQVPAIGVNLAHRIAQQLDIHSLEELEQAAHDGRLEKVDGFGPKRLQSVRVSLAGMLSGAAQRRIQKTSSGEKPQDKPNVKILLEVDEEYRKKAESGRLKKIAPHRFNPEVEAWLPILHTEKEGWSFTALYSNTARAHQLGKVNDWVVIYYEKRKEDQCTVVTETKGKLEGKRVVRGREYECQQYYESRIRL